MVEVAKAITESAKSSQSVDAIKTNFDGKSNEALKTNFDGKSNEAIKTNFDGKSNEAIKTNFDDKSNETVKPNFDSEGNKSQKTNQDFVPMDRDPTNGGGTLDDKILSEKVPEQSQRVERSSEANQNAVEKNETSENKEDSDVKKVHTRNEHLEGKEHPETGVPFERRTVNDGEGNEVEGVFPEFDSEFDAQLPEDMYKESDKTQFDECNRQLKEAVENDPDLAKKFDKEQLEQIADGETPDGYTWHHDAETGKMQLVDTKTHQATGHTGGKSIWGGGSENR